LTVLRRFELYSLRADAPADAVRRLCCALRDCGRFIPEVLHSAIGSNLSSAPLQLAWEHAYASPEAYRRYMAHPFHAAVLDRHLLADSPERIVSDNALGAGLVGYACAEPVYRLTHGVRRLVLLRVAGDAAPARVRALATSFERARDHGTDLTVSVFAENTFGSRWFDGVTELTARPRWTHLWEQGFASHAALASYRAGETAAARAERDGFAAWDDVVERSLEVIYELEPGHED
jgi:hypothetical protein